MVKIGILSLLIILKFSVCFAEEDAQFWNRIYAGYQKDKLEYGIQLQLRYSDDQHNFYEEQINASIQHNFDDINKSYLGVILTTGFSGRFDHLAERRFAIQYGFRPKTFYQIRFRYELRNFSDQDSFANRFRVLNGFDSKKPLFMDFTPFILSEFNFYLNDFGQTQSGLSSHRTIIGLVGGFLNNKASISYVNDLKFISQENFTRHILEFAYIF